MDGQGEDEEGELLRAEIDAARLAFGSELRRLRQLAGLSQRSLANQLGYHTSYISKVELGSVNPTEIFASRADNVLDGSGALTDRWQTFVGKEHERSTDHSPPHRSTTAREIAVLQERSVLTYADGKYRISIVRHLANLTRSPVNAYPVRIHVDAFPHDPDRSREHHRANPLIWTDIDFRCWHARDVTDFDDPRGPNGVTELRADPRQTVTDNIIEGWIHFEGIRDRQTMPLHTGRQMALKYTYVIDDLRWGKWFQRSIRLPTARLEVALVFPRALDPVVWGKKGSLQNPLLAPLESEIAKALDGSRAIWSWRTTSSLVGDRYRFEWRFGRAQ